MDDRPDTLDPEAGIDHFPSDAHVVPHLQRPRRDADGAAVGQGLCKTIDDAATHAVPRKLGGHGETDRSGAYNQRVFHDAVS